MQPSHNRPTDFDGWASDELNGNMMASISSSSAWIQFQSDLEWDGMYLGGGRKPKQILEMK